MYMDDERPMNEPTNEPMDDSLRELVARAYQAPEGAVPRDEMWARINAARRATRGTPALNVEHVEHVDHVDRREEVITLIIPLRRHQRAVWRWSAALAAGLILGIAVDRALVQRDGASGSGASMPPIAANHTDTRGVAPESTTAPAPIQRVAVAPSERSSMKSGTRTPSPTEPSTGRAGAPVPPIAERTPVAQADPSVPDANDLYHAAAVQTLVQAEALLTAYRRTGEAAPDPVAVQQAGRWARDVLSSTRLLMDSPAARDPRMRMLFSDLELVLAQIVQLSGAPLQASERELIERALRDRDLLPRLRSAVPAGLTTS
jgi:hypothetical protein